MRLVEADLAETDLASLFVDVDGVFHLAAQPGVRTFVHSWVPDGGPIIGMVVRHAESFTISDHLTVWEDTIEGYRATYRPTVHYAYLPCDNALLSLHELAMRNFKLQPKLRIMSDKSTAATSSASC